MIINNNLTTQYLKHKNYQLIVNYYELLYNYYAKLLQIIIIIQLFII